MRSHSKRQYLPVVALLLTSIVSRAVSQPAPPLPRPGDRVRVSVGYDRHIGVLDSLQADTVFLRGRPPVALGFKSRLEIAVGRKGHTLEGLALGFLIGGAAGSLAAYGMVQGTGSMDYGAAAGALAVAAGVWLGSTVLGAVIGSGKKSDRWRHVLPWPPPSTRPTATLWPEGGPVTAGLRIPIRIAF